MVREKIMTMKILMLENHVHFTSMGMMKLLFSFLNDLRFYPSDYIYIFIIITQNSFVEDYL